jgi:DNA (cytosine-5)-methyltransferase 1
MYTLQAGKQHAVADTLVSGGRELPPHGTGDGKNIVAYPVLSREGKGPASGVDSGNIVVTHTLSSEGADASEDGTGRGTPIVAFDTTQITSRANGSQPQPGDPCHPLAAAGHPPAVFGVAYSIAPGACNKPGGQEDIYVKEINIGRTLDSTGADPSRKQGGTLVGDGVPRRLTPRECERLQAFPDDWTRWTADEKEIADGPRYRMLGNAVTVNVAEWIGRRIMAGVTA